MENNDYEIGMIGLGVMGRNLVLNFADHGFSVAGFDMDRAKVIQLKEEAEKRTIYGSIVLQDFITRLRKPRAVMMLVPAGAPVDAVINELIPLLAPGDLIIDGGNSHFTDTNKRLKELADRNIHFIGLGISGGESGARFGPSFMPGGAKDAYDRISPILETSSAKVNGENCVAYLGPGSAGHYVKMVHNGIEYALMQVISESYDLLKRGLELTNYQLSEVYSTWNKGLLQSFLIEITADIFQKQDDEPGSFLIDKILDEAKQKGTGKWTSQDAMDIQVPVPTIDAAVSMRDISAYKSERDFASGILFGPDYKIEGGTEPFIRQIESSLYFAMITIFAQGMAMLKTASAEYKYDLKLEEVAKIWRGGCIIRASVLENICAAFEKSAGLSNLLIDPYLSKEILNRQDDIRSIIKTAVENGIPVPGLSASLAYFDSYRSGWLPANLVQAQRDYFGAHTYERNDEKGTFHTQWNHI
ncbi:MAG: NADP-dependent phosphogluconate dehydrogenase [Ignavibacteriaceae bacterium]|nr:NADP-dependent phosphogluconate dehydrogenase [Ignavibacteriaceae bacterium]